MQLGCGQYLMHSLSPLFAAVVMDNGGGGVGGGMANILALAPASSSGRGGAADNSMTVVAALDEVQCALRIAWCVVGVRSLFRRC